MAEDDDDDGGRCLLGTKTGAKTQLLGSLGMIVVVVKEDVVGCGAIGSSSVGLEDPPPSPPRLLWIGTIVALDESDGVSINLYI